MVEKFHIVSTSDVNLLYGVLMAMLIVTGLILRHQNQQKKKLAARGKKSATETARNQQIRKAAFIVVVGAMIAAVVVTYQQANAWIEIREHGVKIHAGLYSQFLYFPDIDLENVREIDLTSREGSSYLPKIRTNGTTFKNFHAGWFKTLEEKKSFMLVTDRKRVVLIPSNRGIVYLLSLRRPKEFLNQMTDSLLN